MKRKINKLFNVTAPHKSQFTKLIFKKLAAMPYVNWKDELIQKFFEILRNDTADYAMKAKTAWKRIQNAQTRKKSAKYTAAHEEHLQAERYVTNIEKL